MTAQGLRIDASRRDVWRYAEHYAPTVSAEHRLTLGEGGTPLVSVPGLARAIGVAELLLKRDDLSPGGSHKARSLAYRVSLALARGEPAVTISSSGNAAVAASLYAAVAGVRLIAFVSPATSDSKLRWLRRGGTVLIQTAKPRNLARYAGRLYGIPNLTPSLDDLSIEGFKSIAAEIAESAPGVDALFTFVTSGSSLVGMARMFDALGGGPALHAVQSGAKPAVAGPTDLRWQKRVQAGAYSASTLAGLLGVEETPRAEEARAWVERSAGSGWVEEDDEIREAAALLRGAGIDTSPEGAACVSAVRRARASGALDASARVVVLLTGHASQWPADDPVAGGECQSMEGYAELRAYLGTFLEERSRADG